MGGSASGPIRKAGGGAIRFRPDMKSGGGAGVLSASGPIQKAGRGGGGGCLAEEEVPYMKGGVATPNPSPPLPPGSASVHAPLPTTRATSLHTIHTILDTCLLIQVY